MGVNALRCWGDERWLYCLGLGDVERMAKVELVMASVVKGLSSVNERCLEGGGPTRFPGDDTGDVTGVGIRRLRSRGGMFWITRPGP